MVGLGSALVLGGGGVAGIAWITGVLAGLAEACFGHHGITASLSRRRCRRTCSSTSQGLDPNRASPPGYAFEMA